LPALFIVAHSLQAQKVDSLRKSAKRPEDKMTLSLYERVIWDAQGNARYDENIVSNFKLNPWLRGEGGIRFGHRPEKFDSYFHYKLELQTKFFWQTVRFFIRLSNDVNKSTPVYARSYYLAVAEIKQPISKSFSFLGSFGEVLATHRDNTTDVSPSFSGVQTNYFAYRIGLRYLLKEKGYMEGMIGNYDVFNPYMPSNSFLQTHFEYDLSRRVSFTSNLRYQFNTSLDKPLGYFIIAGVKLHFAK